MRFLLVFALLAAPCGSFARNPSAEGSAPAPNLSGVWEGTYGYASGSEGTPVSFSAHLCVHDGAISGKTVEPATFGDKSADELKANISGRYENGEFHFRKTYDGTGGVNHTVMYDGKLDGTSLTGQWDINGGKGPFELRLRKNSAQEAGCPAEPQPLLMR
jgi:hypothetical protein